MVMKYVSLNAYDSDSAPVESLRMEVQTMCAELREMQEGDATSDEAEAQEQEIEGVLELLHRYDNEYSHLTTTTVSKPHQGQIDRIEARRQALGLERGNTQTDAHARSVSTHC